MPKVNTPPEINIASPANGDAVVIQEIVNFTALAADAENDSLTVVWKADGEEFHRSAGIGANNYNQDAANAFFTAGRHEVSVTVMDDDGASATHTIFIHVNTPPLAHAGSDASYTMSEGTAAMTVYLNGMLSADADGDLLTYFWYEGTGTVLAGGGIEPQVTLTEGVHEFKLVVNDGFVASEDTVVITVIKPMNHAPTAYIDAPSEGQSAANQTPLSFAGRGTDPDLGNTIASYAWDFGNGQTSALQNPTLAYTVPGRYTVNLKVKDNKGAESIAATRTITVLNTLPEIILTASPADSAGTVTINAGQSVSFSAAASDADGDTLTYAWSFGNGQTFTAQNPGNVVYPSAGTYTATLTVTDSRGGTATAQKTIQVNSAYTPMFTVNGRQYSNAGNVSSGQVSWNTASAACASLTEGNGGWRLPTKAELLADVAVWKTYLSGVTFLWGGDGVTAGKAWVVSNLSLSLEMNKGYLASGLGYRCVRAAQ